MPLFKARVEVVTVVDIPVIAESEQAANEYIKKHSDWKEWLIETCYGDTARAVSVAPVSSELDIPSDWDMDDECWNQNDKVGMAFFQDALPYPPTMALYEAGLEECQVEAVVDKYWSDLEKMCADIDASRKAAK